MTEEKEKYCLDCKFRKHQLISKNSFCENGAVCGFNPWGRETKRDLRSVRQAWNKECPCFITDKEFEENWGNKTIKEEAQ